MSNNQVNTLFSVWLLKNYKPTKAQLDWARDMDNHSFMRSGIGSGKKWAFSKLNEFLKETNLSVPLTWDDVQETKRSLQDEKI